MALTHAVHANISEEQYTSLREMLAQLNSSKYAGFVSQHKLAKGQRKSGMVTLSNLVSHLLEIGIENLEDELQWVSKEHPLQRS